MPRYQNSRDFGSENLLFKRCGYVFVISLALVVIVFVSNALNNTPLKVSGIVRRSDQHTPPSRFVISYSPVPGSTRDEDAFFDLEEKRQRSAPSSSTTNRPRASRMPSSETEIADDDFTTGTAPTDSTDFDSKGRISAAPSIDSKGQVSAAPSTSPQILPSLSSPALPSLLPSSSPEAATSVPLLECSASPFQQVEFEGAIYNIFIQNEKRVPCSASTIGLFAERVNQASFNSSKDDEESRLDRLRGSIALELLTYTNRSSVKPRTVPSEYASVWHRDQIEAHSCSRRVRADVNPLDVSRGPRLLDDCKRIERILPLRKPSAREVAFILSSSESGKYGAPFASAIYLPDSSSEFYHVRLSLLSPGITSIDYAASKASNLDELKVFSGFYSGLVSKCAVSPLLEIQRVGATHIWHHCREQRPQIRDAFDHLPIGYGNNCPPVLHLPIPSAADFEVAVLSDGNSSPPKDPSLLNFVRTGDLSFTVAPGAKWQVIYRVALEVAAQFPNAHKHAAFLGRVSNNRIAYGVDFPAGMEYNKALGGYVVSGSIRDSGPFTLEVYVAEFFGDNFGELVNRLPDYFLRGKPEVGSAWDEDLLSGFVINVGPFTDHSLGTCCMHRSIAGTKNAEIIVSGSNPTEDPMKTIETAAASAAAEFLTSKQAQKDKPSPSSTNDDQRRLEDLEKIAKKKSQMPSWRRRAAEDSISKPQRNHPSTSSSTSSLLPLTGFEGLEWNEDEEDVNENDVTTHKDQLKGNEQQEEEEEEDDGDDQDELQERADAYTRRLAASAASSTTKLSDVQAFGSKRCTRADLPGRWIRLDEQVPCSPPFCSGDRRKSVSAMDWSGATRHWVFVPFECYYHLYTIADVSCCAAENNLRWTLVMGDSPVREIFGNMLNFNGSTERYAKFDAIDAVAGLPPPMRLTFQFWHTSFFGSDDFNRARGGERRRPFSVDKAYLDHFNVLPSETSGKPFHPPGSEHIAPMRVPAKGAEHLYSGLETDTETTRPDLFIANGALAYESMLNSVETIRSWTADFVKAVRESASFNESISTGGDQREKFKPMRSLWVKGPSIFSQPHGAAESISISRASLFDTLSTNLAIKAGWEVLDADVITRCRWEDAWDGLHMLREANGDWKGLTSAMVTEAMLNAAFNTPGCEKCGGGC